MNRLFALAALSTLALGGSLLPASAGELLGPGVVSTRHNETSTSLTPDGRTIYFMRGDLASGDTTILTAERTDDGFRNVRVAPFSGIWKDSEPHVTPDGSRLFFVSNRPVAPGGETLVATRGRQRFPGANLWYVERTSTGWGPPVHVDGEVNRVPMVYNPSMAANGVLYFSAHREDSGSAYQIYRAARDGSGYRPPERIDLGIGIEGNHMDPAIDPQERFILFAGDEGDSAGSADIYIAFRTVDGGWGTPMRLPEPVNSPYLENAQAWGAPLASSSSPACARSRRRARSRSRTWHAWTGTSTARSTAHAISDASISQPCCGSTGSRPEPGAGQAGRRRMNSRSRTRPTGNS